MRVSVDPWDPSYGTSVDTDPLADPTAHVNLAVERPLSAWAPITPPLHAARLDALAFVDGVRRVEARVWVEPDGEGDGGDAELAAGLSASWAAGVVRCEGDTSAVVATRVGRGLFTASPAARDLVTDHGVFTAHVTAGTSPDALSLALQEAMTASELDVAIAAAAPVSRRETVGSTLGDRSPESDPTRRCSAPPSGAGAGGEIAVAAAPALPAGPPSLLIVDGPLRGRQHLAGAVGLIKTHHVEYLPPDRRSVLRALAPGQRTPVFIIGTTWHRHSWYVRLPGDGSGPRHGLVRLEAAAARPIAEVVALADATAATLPRFASAAHKDPRAPQNLVPIAGLERELRRRLGDPQLLYRALRRAAASGAALGAA